MAGRLGDWVAWWWLGGGRQLGGWVVGVGWVAGWLGIVGAGGLVLGGGGGVPMVIRWNAPAGMRALNRL